VFSVTQQSKIKVGVIGGGAAGFFFALQLAEKCLECQIILFEKSPRFLAKVKVSGGGRCNVTNATYYTNKLVENYPRGQAFLKKIMDQFNVRDTIDWFHKQGVELKTEPDNRIFPVSDSSDTIIQCFLDLAKRRDIELRSNAAVQSITPYPMGFRLNGTDWQEEVHYVFVATGGQHKIDAYHWLQEQGITIHPPLPSLFTFNLSQHPFKGLEGISLMASVSIERSKLNETGSLLFTHWGLSGPVILRLSAWGAKETFERDYQFTAYINFIPGEKQETVRDTLSNRKVSTKMKMIRSNREFGLPSRLWERLTELGEVPSDLRWGDVSLQKINKLVELLCHFPVQVKGKTTFKEEFVTCGGVSLDEVDNRTLESLAHPNLYFGGEVLDIDGITGGFNFQSAWSSAWVAANAISHKIYVKAQV
jgi:predicted Rossmann fold flavoprotein